MAFPVGHTQNGPRITRHMEIDELIARSRQRRNEPLSKTESLEPKIGLLSQTIIPSPTIHMIIPARLRSKHQNDVVFISDRSIQLREIIMGTYLKDVVIKSDFDASIVAAKTIRASPEVPWDVEMKQRAHNGSPEQIPDKGDSLPPQLLVLTLDSKELVFLYCQTSAPDNSHFVYFHRPLPSDVNILERYGRHLAVDPRSRAIAVAAAADFFGIFIIKSPQELQSQMAQGVLNPISQERFFQFEGDILFMDFLYAQADDADRIILLLIVAKGQDTLAVCYDWDSINYLRQGRPRIFVRQLPADCRLPNMLIPLTKATSFMLVTSTSMIIYRKVLDASVKRLFSRSPLPSPGTLSAAWTRWARPFRNLGYNEEHDDIYLCREDGRLYFLTIGNTGNINSQSHLGQLGCDVDAAFDIVCTTEGGDLLLAAGNMGDGGLFIQQAREDPKCVQKFLNWAPVMDAVVVSPHSSYAGESQYALHDRLFVCSGSTTGSGAIVELRYGIEARIGLAISLEDLSSTRSIWTMPVNSGIYFLMSDPVSTTLLYLPRDSGEDIYAMDESDLTLKFSSQTLAAGYTTAGAVIQVTDNSIRLAALNQLGLNCVHEYETGQTVVAAAVDGKIGLVATTIRAHQAIHLHVHRISPSNGSFRIDMVGQSLEISHEPISILIDDIESHICIFIGTSEGQILLFQVDSEGISHLSDLALDLSGDDISKAIESMAMVTASQGYGQHYKTLYCGLRSGLLIPLDLRAAELGHGNFIGLRQGTPRRLGQTGVKINTNPTRDGLALVTCGPSLWHLSSLNSNGQMEYSLQHIWITDQNNPSFVQRSIDVLTLIDAHPDPRPDCLAESLACISDRQLLVCNLDRLSQTVPRRIDLPGSATRVAYSRHLRSLVVAYTTVEMDADVDPIKRYIRPNLDFINVDYSHSEDASSQVAADAEHTTKPWRPCGASGERITCILDWTPKRDGYEYHFIIIGTSRRNQDAQGRVIFLQAQRSRINPEQIECSVKHIHKFEGPVRALAPYGEFTLMVATGYDVVPLEPKFSEKRWVRAARFRLTSPGISITANLPYLYVSTARESLIILHVIDGKLELYAHDGVKREGLAHYHIGGDAQLTLATSRGGTLSALSEIGVTESDKTISPAVVEAHLPLSITRLVPSSATSPSLFSTVVYGTTMDGTVYRVFTLTEKEWRLLKFLQNLCSKDATISPILSIRKKRLMRADIELLSSKPSSMHVNGDILARLVKLGPNHLRDMLSSDTCLSSSDTAVLPPRPYTELFVEISNDLLGKTSDPVSQVMDWLRKLLHFAF